MSAETTRAGVRSGAENSLLSDAVSVVLDYLSLTKPRIISLLLLTTVATMFVADPAGPSLSVILWTMLGGYLAAGGAGAINHYLDRAATAEETESIRREILGTPGILGVHDLRTRRTGDLLLVDAHLEVDGSLTVEEGHRIAVDARRRVMERHPVLNMMTHVDPRQV